MSTIFLQSWRPVWTLRRLTLVYKFLVTLYLDKTAERTRMVVELFVYVKDTYKASVITKLSAVSDCNFQQLWLKVQCKKLKSFLLCTVYRPPNSPITFLEDIEKTFVDSLLLGMEVIIIGDLNCNLQGNCPDGRALSDFCSTFNLTQMVKEPTRVTDKSQMLIDVVLTTNENIVNACEVMSSAITAWFV